MKNPSIILIGLLCAVLLSSGCGSLSDNETRPESNTIDPALQRTPPAISKSNLEEDITVMRDAGIDKIFVIRRRDGAAFDDEDRDFLRRNIPLEVNRILSSDDDKAFIVGSTFLIPPDNVKAWRSRFEVQDRTEKKIQ